MKCAIKERNSRFGYRVACLRRSWFSSMKFCGISFLLLGSRHRIDYSPNFLVAETVHLREE